MYIKFIIYVNLIIIQPEPTTSKTRHQGNNKPLGLNNFPNHQQGINKVYQHDQARVYDLKTHDLMYCLFHSGFDNRVRLELEKIIPDGIRLGVYSPSNKQAAVWCGAANLATMTSFAPYWISREQFDEHGTSIVHKRCWSCT